MTDDLMQDIEAEYLYQCRRSFETQDCGIAANLLDRIKTELSEKDARIAALEAALREAYEVYAGSDGFIAETAAEGYLQQLISEMVAIIGAGLKK
jgi:hypothetical protein